MISLLAACTPVTPAQPSLDVHAIRTAAAETVIAEFTQTALAVPPTSTITATETITLTPDNDLQPTETVITQTTSPFESTATEVTCDDAIWIADITVPDGTETTPGQDFVKTGRHTYPVSSDFVFRSNQHRPADNIQMGKFPRPIP